MVIDPVLVYHFIDPDLGIEIVFDKWGAVEYRE